MAECKIAKVVTADGEVAVSANSGILSGVLVTTNGTNAATVLVENGTTEMFTFSVPGASLSGYYPMPAFPRYATLNVTVTGTGAGAYVFYVPSKLAELVG